MRVRIYLAAILVVAGLIPLTALAQAGGFGDWAPAQKIDEIAGNSSELNTAALDGCPIQSPDGLSLYMASNRTGGLGGLDIWVATRKSTKKPWGAPVNLGEPVNSTSDDFCPTPIGKRGLFFVSREALPGACGQGDIYFTRHSRRHGWRAPVRLACDTAGGPNSALDEQGPSYVDSGRKTELYFSRSSAAPAVPGEIFVSRLGWGGFGPASPVAELNDATANDIQPNVRRDGLEVVLSSNRAGGVGAQDIWIATRKSTHKPWSAPVNLAAVNTTAAESRPSLSKRGEQLLLGRAPGPEGMSDIYVTTRAKHHPDPHAPD
jgi:hypothetical protein